MDKFYFVKTWVIVLVEFSYKMKIYKNEYMCLPSSKCNKVQFERISSTVQENCKKLTIILTVQKSKIRLN